MDNNEILDIYPLHVEIKHKIARYNRQDGVIVCDNSNYQIIFTFDDEWSEYPIKTARFVWNDLHTDVVFNGTTCKVPVLNDTSFVAVGVYAGDLRTTTPAIIYCKKSILCENPEHIPPEPDVYNQIMKLMNGFSVKVEKVGDETTITTTDPNGTHVAIVRDGKNGITPHIGENGHWFVGSEDTGVPAQGNGGGSGSGSCIQTVTSTDMADTNTTFTFSIDRKLEQGKLYEFCLFYDYDNYDELDEYTCDYPILISDGTTTFNVFKNGMSGETASCIDLLEQIEYEYSAAGTHKYRFVGYVETINNKSYVVVIGGNTSYIKDYIKRYVDGKGFLTEHQDISGKVDKVDGKGLSTEDYTTEEKAKLNGIDIDKIKADLSAKIDKPSAIPEVGKILKVTAVNDDGTFVCEWSDANSGGVTDVQINGESIITDGVAHIPITQSNWSETSGFVLRRIHRSYGLVVLDGGTTAIMQANENQIDGRSANYNPIAPEKLDYAVKATMCDGKGAAWTDAERIAALLRMGCTVDENGFVKWTAQEVAE